MKSFKERVELYFRHRRQLGYSKNYVESGLSKFAEFADSKGHKGPLTVPLALEWAQKSKKGNRSSWKRRLDYLHTFAKYCKAVEPETELPPLNIYGNHRKRPNPYIYSKKEINALMDATKNLKSEKGLWPITFNHLLGLLASTGLRTSEAIHLTLQDVDLETGLLSIHETKYHKSRLVPIHNSTKQALKKYAESRDERMPSLISNHFFITDKGHSLNLGKVEIDFRFLRKLTGLPEKARLYDFRHTFACRRLLQWYQEGKDVNQMIIYLSTYLGHLKVTDTFWYLSSTPELMEVISSKFEQSCMRG